ncbi:phenylacetate-CoA oxygenase subunit PaaC [Virgibacillus sp. AGTR]|nr:1,2-phenylacetyl-CoA epoxidase subunit PaaC [Virgibacillus sp. Bac332]MCC2251690.1 phenylacetate-CoA oxygenase subunit PaaC [Virgibacillus sp. AGTR]
MVKRIDTAKEAKQNPSYFEALVELLFQLADDDFIISFRGSEWLGLAPHIEEDVALSSITQNTMGHASLYYHLLEDLDIGNADKLAHERQAVERRNASYFERKNGEGSYLQEPYYDWALTVVRQFLFETMKKVKLETIINSSYQPLADIANKVLMEQPYHLAHWRMWLKQLLGSTEEAQNKVQFQLEAAWPACADIIGLGPKAFELEKHHLIAGEDYLRKQWLKELEQSLSLPSSLFVDNHPARGRYGEHTADLDQALSTLSEVYNSDQKAVW